MSRRFEALLQRRDAARLARTLKGRILNIGGRIFSVYCIIRIVSVRTTLPLSSPYPHLTCLLPQSTVNVLFPSRRSSSSRSSYPDLITDILAYVLSFVTLVDVKFEEVALLSRQLSLGLVGLIILTSLRLVLKGVTRVSSGNYVSLSMTRLICVCQALRVTSRNLGASLMMLFLAQLMASEPPLKIQISVTNPIYLKTGNLPPLNHRAATNVVPGAAGET